MSVEHLRPFANVAAVQHRAMRVLHPPRKVSLPRWIEETVRLPAGGALPGPVRLWPQQRGIAEAIGDPAIPRVSVLKSVRVGYSFLLSAAIASFADNDPSNILLVLPRDTDCREFIVGELDRLLEASPALRGLLPYKDRRNRSNTLTRRFSGGELKVRAAQSPTNFRGHTSRIVLLDEIDSESFDPSEEGDPIDLAMKRSDSFFNFKVVAGSTPTNFERGRILRLYAESDRRVYEICCAECGALAEPKWEHIKWEKDRPETAAWECPNCSARIAERFKPQMIAHGAWRSLAPEIEGHAGFKLTALASTHPGAAWGKLARDFRAAHKRPDKLKVFINQNLAEEWADDLGEQLDETGLMAKAEAFSIEAIPAAVLWITAGVDVQHDRLEVTLLGHTADDVIFVLDHEKFYGNPPGAKDDSWKELDDHLRSTWPHPLGGRIGVSAAAVDSGDGQTLDVVREFTRARQGRRVFSIKGDDGNLPLWKMSKQRGLAIVGVDTGKVMLRDWLKEVIKPRVEDGEEIPPSIRFSNTLEADWYLQLTAERLIKKRMKGGYTAHKWDPIPGRRSEALDCCVYGMACRTVIKADAQSRENDLRCISTPAAPAVQRIKYLSGG